MESPNLPSWKGPTNTMKFQVPTEFPTRSLYGHHVFLAFFLLPLMEIFFSPLLGPSRNKEVMEQVDFST